MDYLGEQILLCYQTLCLNQDVLKQTAKLICDLEVPVRNLTLTPLSLLQDQYMLLYTWIQDIIAQNQP